MDLLSITDAARLKDTTRATIYALVKKGKIDAQEVAGRHVIINNQRFQEVNIQRGLSNKELRKEIKKLKKQIEEPDYTFKAVFTKLKDSDYWASSLKDFPGIISQGRTLEEARSNLRNAFLSMIKYYSDTAGDRRPDLEDIVVQEEVVENFAKVVFV